MSKSNLSDICDQARSDYMIYTPKNYGGNNKKISISGHSAGAHLVSYLLSIDWSKYDLPKKIFQGAALISGIYNLKIVQKISVNKELNLSNKEVQEKLL